MESFLHKVVRKAWWCLKQLPFFVFVKPILLVRSFFLTLHIDEGGGRIVLKDPFMSVVFQKKPGSKLVVKGTLTIERFLFGKNPILFSLSENAELHINGDFIIGQGVRFRLDRNAVLTIGGKACESGSGITADALIMVHKRMEIGKDLLAGWNVYLTDCDWHQLTDKEPQADVIIGDHVWLANQCTILKGTVIGDDCMVAACSRLSGRSFEAGQLIGGIPAKVLKTGVTWKRDLT